MNGGLVLANGKTKFSVFTMAYPKSTNGNYSPIIEFEQTNGTRFEVQGANRNGFAGIDMPVLDAKSPLPRGTPNPRAQIGSMVANTTNLVIGLDGTDSTALATPVTTVSGAAARVGTSNRGPLRAYIGDIIVYGVTVSSIQRRKIETYLAVKYGVTLANNYVDTAGTTIYTVSSNNKKIIGLGRDSKSDLLQKQSQTPDDSARIYLSTLVATNSANIGTITNDVSYVVMGGDAGKMNATGASVAEMSSGLGLHSRLEREWKITKTNFVDVINIDLKLSAAARPGSVDVSHLRLLIDDDGNFGNGGTTSYANGDGSGIVISYSNPTITISNITSTQIANNSTKYFTIGTTNSATPLPIELTYFNAAPINRMVQLKWQTASERNNDYYTVECSANGTDWKTVGSISAAGNSTSELNYTLYDEEPTIGVSYYRLKQTDYDGQYTYSEIKAVRFTVEVELALIL